MESWKTVSRQILLEHSKYLRVEGHTVELPDGQTIADWAWIITPDYVNVVLVTEDEQFVLFRQPKYAVAGISLAPVGGYIEPEEDPLTTAQREVLEETGYHAKHWQSLGQYTVDGNRGAGTAHLFLATGAYPVCLPSADDLEEQELLLMDRAAVEAALHNGEFKVLGWAAAVALALTHLR